MSATWKAWALGVVAVTVTAASLFAAPEDRPLASFATSLNGRNRAQRLNAERALHRLTGAVVKPGEIFSFNGKVGSFSRDDGYRKAPVSYNGQLIDSWGGGVCQASTTVYNAALLSGMRIVERHRHEFCPSYVAPGRDAAVAYNDIDLKFQNPLPFPVKILASAQGGVLRVDFIATHALPAPVTITSEVSDVQKPVEYTLGTPGRQGRVRNSGKAGYEVAVYRQIGATRELISQDQYPAMNRVVDFGG